MKNELKKIKAERGKLKIKNSQLKAQLSAEKEKYLRVKRECYRAGVKNRNNQNKIEKLEQRANDAEAELKDVKRDYNRIYRILNTIVDEGCYDD